MIGRAQDDDPDGALREVLFEVRLVGNAAKISAIDPATNTEVSVIGPANADPYTLKMNALRKLKAVLRKRAQD